MTTISHKHTAKAAIRNLFAAYGASGTLQLIAEVLSESIPQRRGRPTRAEGVARLGEVKLPVEVPGLHHLDLRLNDEAIKALLVAQETAEVDPAFGYVRPNRTSKWT